MLCQRGNNTYEKKTWPAFRARPLERLGTYFRKLWNSDTRMGRSTSSMECLGELLLAIKRKIKTWSRICCVRYVRLAQHIAYIATLPQERLVWGIVCSCPAGTPNWSPTFWLGVETFIPLRVARLWAVDWCCYESPASGSTLRSFHRVVRYIGRLYDLDLIPANIKSSRVEPACPKAAPLGRRETTKPKLLSTLTVSASKIQ